MLTFLKQKFWILFLLAVFLGCIQSFVFSEKACAYRRASNDSESVKSKLFLKKNASQAKSYIPNNFSTPFWKKIPLLANFYKTYQWADLPFTYEFFLTISLALFTLSFTLSATIVSFVTAILIALFLTYLYFFAIKILARRNHHRISEQLPFVLDTLSGSIQSGYSLPQALRFTAQEVGMPFKLFFKENIRIKWN